MSVSRPRIGVTRWEDVPGERIEDYWERIEEAGGKALDLRDAKVTVTELNGLVLTGGLDIDPARYFNAPHERTRCAEAARDDYEFGLLQEALAADLPVLAICRGHQVLNVAFGGSLLQNIETSNHRADYKSEGAPSRWHEVTIALGSRLHGAIGAGRVEVNSRHHQGVVADGVAPGLKAVATSPDGIVEALESESHRWVVGVQWHAERPEPEHPQFAPLSQPLFQAFLAAAMRQPEEVH